MEKIMEFIHVCEIMKYVYAYVIFSYILMGLFVTVVICKSSSLSKYDYWLLLAEFILSPISAILVIGKN